MYIALIVVAFVLLFVAGFFVNLINRTCVKTVEQLLEPEKVLEKIGAIDDDVFRTAEGVLQEWADIKRFEHVGYFLCHTLPNNESIKCAAWWSEKQRSYLMLYVAMQNMHYEFVSMYEEGGLSTSGSKDSFALPMPSQYHVQVFDQCNIDELLKKHKKGLRTLKSKRDLSPLKKPADSLYQMMQMTLRKQAEYVQKIPLWQHRGAYWFFIKKHLLANKPVRG